MGEFEQAARDLVDGANAGDENAMAMLHLVGENARKGRPFRACVVYELAMRYALGKDKPSNGYAAIAGEYAPPVPSEVYEGLWRAVERGRVGKLCQAFGRLREHDGGKEAVITAFALGPRLTDSRIASLLRSFEGDPVGQALAAKGMADPSEVSLLPLVEAAGDEAWIIEACYFLGACIMLARLRQCLVSGNFGVDKRVEWELGTPTRRERTRQRR
jgi:hypothetical protein